MYAEPRQPGKAIYATAAGADGVLIGWTPPPRPAVAAATRPAP